MDRSTLIAEFAGALREEVDALKQGKGGGITRLFNGRFLRESSGLYVYLFYLENLLVAVDDSPAEIEIGGRTYQCQIISVRGLEVEIGLEQSVGPAVGQAKVQTNSWFLLEMLAKKFEESRGANQDFRLGDRLFSGTSVSITATASPELRYTTDPKQLPNASQQAAIRKSFSQSLAIIWGPPGTGKTKTVAKAVEAHLNAGRRVLFVSHANVAVDQAMEDIAEQLECNPLYQEGKLLRLGVCRKSLEERFPLVVLDGIASKLGESLTNEKQTLSVEREKLEATLDSLSDVTSLQDTVKTLGRETAELTKALTDAMQQAKEVRTTLDLLEELQRRNERRLAEAKASGKLKRLFLGLNPSQIQWDIDSLTIKIDAQARTARHLSTRVHEIEDARRDKEAQGDSAKALLSRRLSMLGLTEETLKQHRSSVEQRRDEIATRLAEIAKALEELQARVLADAMLVATTLTKTYSAKQFPTKPFDVVIVDEASMAPLPALYWATGRASLASTIVGDFKQLPPICVSKDDLAQKWLKRSIFDVLGLNEIELAKKDARVTLLDTQYRMNPVIAGLASKLFYSGLVISAPETSRLVMSEPFGKTNPLVLVDTSATNPWCTHLTGGSFFNLYSALVATSIAKHFVKERQVKVGIVTPFRPQARLIGKIAEDWGILESLHVDTVHRFQGDEETVIVFDCVEGPGGTRGWSFLDDFRPDSDARLLVNVALTRAKRKVFVVAHQRHFIETLRADAAIRRVIEAAGAQCTVGSNVLVDDYLATDFDKWATAVVQSGWTPTSPQGTLFTDKTFWPAFLRDLASVKTRLILMSPFVTLARAGRLMDFLQVLVNRGVEVRVYTKPPSEQSGHLSEDAEEVIEQLKRIGATTIQRKGMHQKIAILDGALAWEGSLNILSHKDTQEHMRRLEGENTVAEIIERLELGEESAVGNVSDIHCPQCGRPMVVRRSKYGTFLGCSGYPACKHTLQLSGEESRPRRSLGGSKRTTGQQGRRGQR